MENFQPFRWQVRVFYEDTDVGGLVYHANYLKYFERARTELLRSIGVHQQALFAEKTAFVVRHMEIDFVKGATLDQLLTVETSIIQRKRVTMTFLQRLVNDLGQELCKATVSVACIDPEKMKPKSICSSISLETFCDG